MTEPHAMLSDAEAVALTMRIRDEVKGIWALLVGAHDRGAWAALGYDSWDMYVTAEFDTTADEAYRLVDRARVLPADDAEPSEVELSEPEARNLVGQVVLSLEALTMGLDLVELSTLPEDAHAAVVITEAVATFTRLSAALQPAGRASA